MKKNCTCGKDSYGLVNIDVFFKLAIVVFVFELIDP